MKEVVVRCAFAFLLLFSAYIGHAEDLAGICLGRSAVTNVVYSRGLTVFAKQILENGVLATVSADLQRSYGRIARNVFVEMDTAGIVDGNRLPEDGLYVLTGTYRYLSVAGSADTVYSFRALTKYEREKYKEAKENEDKLPDPEMEKLRVAALEEERLEAVSNVHRMVENFNLDFDKIFYVEKNKVKKFEYKVTHFLWQRLVDAKSNGEFGEFLNVAQAIVDDSDEVEKKFSDDYDDEIKVGKLLDQLAWHGFRLNINMNGQLMVGKKGYIFGDWFWKRKEWRNVIKKCEKKCKLEEQDEHFLVTWLSFLKATNRREDPLFILNSLPLFFSPDSQCAKQIETSWKNSKVECVKSIVESYRSREIGRGDLEKRILEVDKEIDRELSDRFIPFTELNSANVNEVKGIDNEAEDIKTNVSQNVISVVPKQESQKEKKRKTRKVQDSVCEKCGGAGMVSNRKTKKIEECVKCKGTGLIKEDDSVSFADVESSDDAKEERSAHKKKTKKKIAASSKVEKESLVKCDECKGKGYHYEDEECNECEGKGYVLTGGKAMIGGRRSAVRKSQCAKCNGKGKKQVRVKCETCSGKGKVKTEDDGDD